MNTQADAATTYSRHAAGNVGVATPVASATPPKITARLSAWLKAFAGTVSTLEESSSGASRASVYGVPRAREVVIAMVSRARPNNPPATSRMPSIPPSARTGLVSTM